MNTENRSLTPELLEKLNKFKGFSDTSTFQYVPKIYRENVDVIPKKDWPIFKLKGRDGLDLADSEDNMGHELKNGKVYTTTGEVRIKTLQSNILDWKNFKDQDNKNIPFVKDAEGLTKQCIAKLPSPLQVELLLAINDHSILTQEELEGLEF